MKFEKGHVYHVYNQGNNHQPIFITHHDYVEFLHFSKAHVAPYCDILAWCLLPNHFHCMVRIKDELVIKNRFCEVKKKIPFARERAADFVMERVSNLLNSYTKSYN